MIKQSTKDLVLKALDHQLDGDNLYRFELEFKGLSQEKMNEPYIAWGQETTRQAIIDNIKGRNNRIQEAIKEIQNMLVF
jgi:hypothetical protein